MPLPVHKKGALPAPRHAAAPRQLTSTRPAHAPAGKTKAGIKLPAKKNPGAGKVGGAVVGAIVGIAGGGGTGKRGTVIQLPKGGGAALVRTIKKGVPPKVVKHHPTTPVKRTGLKDVIAKSKPTAPKSSTVIVKKPPTSQVTPPDAGGGSSPVSNGGGDGSYDTGGGGSWGKLITLGAGAVVVVLVIMYLRHHKVSVAGHSIGHKGR